MSLVEQVKDDLKSAMKERNMEHVSVLRMLTAAMSNKEKEKRAKIMKGGEDSEEKVSEMSKLTDEEAVEVVSSEVKKRKDAMGQFEQGGRPELAEGEKKELEILSKYMPEQLSEEEIRKIIKAKIEETGAEGPKDMGKVMGAAMPQLKGKADGGLVSKIVQEELK